MEEFPGKLGLGARCGDTEVKTYSVVAMEGWSMGEAKEVTSALGWGGRDE